MRFNRRTVALSTMGLLVSLALATAQRPAALATGPARPAGIKAAGESTLYLYNRDAAQPATVVMDFYKQGGGPAV